MHTSLQSLLLQRGRCKRRCSLLAHQMSRTQTRIRDVPMRVTSARRILQIPAIGAASSEDSSPAGQALPKDPSSNGPRRSECSESEKANYACGHSAKWLRLAESLLPGICGLSVGSPGAWWCSPAPMSRPTAGGDGRPASPDRRRWPHVARRYRKYGLGRLPEPFECRLLAASRVPVGHLDHDDGDVVSGFARLEVKDLLDDTGGDGVGVSVPAG